MKCRFNHDVFILLSGCSSHIYQCTTWTGANDKQTEGVFLWENSGEMVTYTNWAPGNPDALEMADCVDLFYTGEWNDRPCGYRNGFICEKDGI